MMAIVNLHGDRRVAGRSERIDHDHSKTWMKRTVPSCQTAQHPRQSNYPSDVSGQRRTQRAGGTHIVRGAAESH
jgi:hypothetical protein